MFWIPWWVVKDAWYLWFGFTTTLIDLLIDNINPFSPKVPKLEDLNNVEYLSTLLNQPVERVEEGIQQKAEAGGGTGSCQRAITVYLTNGKKLHLFAKTHAATLLKRVFLTFFKVYNNELHFYKELRKTWTEKLSLADTWQPFPDVYCVKDFGRGKFLLILEDTRYRPEGCVFKTILQEPVNVNAVKAICRAFSQQHVAFWRSPPTTVWNYSAVNGLPGNNTPPVVRLLIEGGMSIVKKKFIHRLSLAPEVEETFHLPLAKYNTVRKFWSTQPVTLCHGDAYLSNLFFDSAMERVGFVDFQCLSVEHCLRDISYHLLYSYPPNVLVEIEKPIVQYYLECLATEMKRRGREDLLSDIPSFEDAFFYYKSYSLLILIPRVISCAFGDSSKENYALESLQRIFDNCKRLNTKDVLDKIIKEYK